MDCPHWTPAFKRDGSARAKGPAGAGTVATVSAQAASAGCRVEYAVTSRWQGGFGAGVTITNLGDAVGGWTLAWSYPAGQAVTQAWGATVTQSAAAVTARDAPTPTPLPLATPSTPPASYPNPGVVTGDTGVHDPSVVKTPSGGYLLVHTGANITIKTSTDNAIDSNLFVDDQGRWWLDFGSFWTGIKLIPLDPATGRWSGTSITGIAQRTGGTTAIEAPYIFKHGSYYYLWVSFDLCCQGASSTYRIMVGRSTSVTGPYTDRNGTVTSGGGTQVLAGHGSIHGPGHEAVLADTDAGRPLLPLLRQQRRLVPRHQPAGLRLVRLAVRLLAAARPPAPDPPGRPGS